MTTYTWPLDSILVTSAFGPRRHPITGTHDAHVGVDFRATIGTPVRSIAAGTVTWSTRDTTGAEWIEVDHGDGIRSRYVHLDYRAVRVGQKVAAGQVIAASGMTGRAVGPHLHFEIFVRGTRIDPVPWLTTHTTPPPEEDPMPLTPEDLAAIRQIVKDVVHGKDHAAILRREAHNAGVGVMRSQERHNLTVAAVKAAQRVAAPPLPPAPTTKDGAQ